MGCGGRGQTQRVNSHQTLAGTDCIDIVASVPGNSPKVFVSNRVVGIVGNDQQRGRVGNAIDQIHDINAIIDQAAGHKLFVRRYFHGKRGHGSGGINRGGASGSKAIPPVARISRKCRVKVVGAVLLRRKQLVHACRIEYLQVGRRIVIPIIGKVNVARDGTDVRFLIQGGNGGNLRVNGKVRWIGVRQHGANEILVDIVILARKSVESKRRARVIGVHERRWQRLPYSQGRLRPDW